MANVSALSFEGTVFFALLNELKELTSGYRKAGEVYPFSLKVETEQKTKPSAMKGTYGQTKHTKTRIVSVTGSMSFHEMFAAVFAWALAGEEAEMTAAAGTVTGESVTLIEGEWVKLAKDNVSSVVIAGGVLDTDFKVNGPLGLVYMVPDGALTAGVNSVNYSYAAESGYQVKIGTQAQIRVAILLDGRNLENGEEITCKFDSVVLSSNTEINLITDPNTDFDTIQFNTVFETLDGKDSPGVINGVPLQYYAG
jgi:hypothetical protein